MKICILTIGTSGDVQPYIALGAGLQAAGHSVTIGTLSEFHEQITQAGLQHDTLRGDFLQAAQTSQTPGRAGRAGNPLRMIKQYVEMARDTLIDEWTSAQNAEVLIYNPAAFGGEHLAEKLGVPSFAAFPAPLYTPTRAFPSPFFPFANLGPFNRLSHRLFAQLGPVMYRQPIREWRSGVLCLPPIRKNAPASIHRIATLYAYSPAVVPRPADWDQTVQVTGYWFLETPKAWQPDPTLVEFLQTGPPPVYIGFGSMFMAGRTDRTALVRRALELCGQRAILATGWGGLASVGAQQDVFILESIPHDWLFPQVAAVIHHGGAGTTGAAARAGKPQVICPFVGDQFFWGRRIAALGASPQPIPQKRLTPERLAAAISLAVTDPRIHHVSTCLGEIIRSEDGVGRAVKCILNNV